MLLFLLDRIDVLSFSSSLLQSDGEHQHNEQKLPSYDRLAISGLMDQV